jgi:hypothetical protein
LYPLLVWVALLRTVLPPSVCSLIEDGGAQAASRASAPSPAADAQLGLDTDGGPADEDQLAESDSSEDDDVLVESGASVGAPPFCTGACPQSAHVTLPAHVVPRLDRPPRV